MSELGETLARRRQKLEAGGVVEYDGQGQAKSRLGDGKHNYTGTEHSGNRATVSAAPANQRAAGAQSGAPVETNDHAVVSPGDVEDYVVTSSEEESESTAMKAASQSSAVGKVDAQKQRMVPRAAGTLGAKARTVSLSPSGKAVASPIDEVAHQDPSNSKVDRDRFRKMAKTAKDPDVVELAEELRNDFGLPASAATRLAILKLSKSDDELYDSLLRAVTLTRAGIPVIKISRMGKPSNKSLLQMSNGQVMLSSSGVFKSNVARVGFANGTIVLELGVNAVNAEPMAKYLRVKDLEPAQFKDRVALMKTPDRPYSFIFENARSAQMVLDVINLHQGIGHQLFILNPKPQAAVFHHTAH